VAGPGAAAEEALARLAAGVDAWRRRMARRRAVATGRRWLLVTAAATGAGAAIGHADGQVLVSAAGAGVAAMTAGIARVAAARRVTIAAAARDMDATLALDEQVATALWGAAAGSVTGTAFGPTAGSAAGSAVTGTGGNPLMGGLIEQAARLAERATPPGQGGDSTGYGEWVAVAVTAAAAAAVATAPMPALSTTAAPGASHGGSVRPAYVGSPTGRLPRGHTSGLVSVSPRPATANGGSHPAQPPGQASAGTLQPSPSPFGGTSPGVGTGQPGGATGPGEPSRPAGSPAGPATSVGGTAGSTGTPAPSAGSVPGPASSANSGPGSATSPAGVTGPSGVPASAGSTTGAAGMPATPAPSGHPAAQPGRGSPGGTTAGTARGGSQRASTPARLPLLTGTGVLLLILPGDTGGEGSGGTRDGLPQGNGGSASAPTARVASTGGIGYVLPDANEVPLADQALLGRYF